MDYFICGETPRHHRPTEASAQSRVEGDDRKTLYMTAQGTLYRNALEHTWDSTWK
jgi:hypothetical protein